MKEEPTEEPKKTDLFTKVVLHWGIPSFIGAVVIRSIIGIGQTGYDYEKGKYEAKNVYTSPSMHFDDDGIQDATLQLKNGHKIPLFGLRQPHGAIQYIRADEKRSIDPHCVIDYEKLEKRLNDPLYKSQNRTPKK